MLDWALRVHGREATRALAHHETAADWKAGRRAWRAYYAEQILLDTRAHLRRRPLSSSVLKGVVEAFTASPVQTINVLARATHRRVRRTLRMRSADAPRIPGNARPRPRLGSVSFGDLDGVTPVSSEFGFDRGTPIDRYYIERFLQQNATAIAGRVLEVGDDAYCRRFGGARITQQDILHVDPGNPLATIVGDLAQAGTLPPGAFDCMVLTQTLHLVYDLQAAVAETYRALKPGGSVLLTVPGISQVDRGTWGNTWYWSLTPAAALRLFSDVYGPDHVFVEGHGNVFAATAFLQGVAVEEVDTRKLDVHDSCFPLVVTIRARRRESA
jgi:SAM-dependent methyltransferase